MISLIDETTLALGIGEIALNYFGIFSWLVAKGAQISPWLYSIRRDVFCRSRDSGCKPRYTMKKRIMVM